ALFFFSSRRRHTRCLSDWSSDVCSSDLKGNSSSRRGGANGLCPGTLGNGHWLGQVIHREVPMSDRILKPVHFVSSMFRDSLCRRSEERRVGKSVDISVRRMMKKERRSRW